MGYLIAFPFFCAGGFLFFLMRGSINPVGFEFPIFTFLLTVCAIIAGIEARKNRSFFVPLALNVLGATFFLLLAVLYKSAYDKWVYRGMPEPFEPPISKQYDYSPEFDRQAARLMRKRLDEKISQEEYDHEMSLIGVEVNKQKENLYDEKKNKDIHNTE